MFTQLIQNPSIAAILSGIAAVFLILQLGNTKSSTIKTAALFSALAISLFFIVLLKSRIVWLGIALVVTVIKIKTKKWQLSKSSIPALVLMIAVCVAIAIFYKTGSSLGRLLIYKIDLAIIKQHWLTGINQPFNVVYNHTQAAYFVASNQQYSKEALLASNGFFVFNEWLNIFIQFGIAGFIAALLATVVFVRECFKQLVTHPNKIPVIGVVFFMLVTALVSYPFYFSLYSCVFLCCAVYIMCDDNWWVKATKRIVNLCLYALISIFFIAKEVKAYNTNSHIEDAETLLKNGYVNNALQQAEQQSRSVTDNGKLYQLISKIHFQKNNIDSAIFYIEKAHRFLCTDELHCYWGNCLTEKQDLHQATTQYETAVNIMACRFKNRLLLLNNYIGLKQYSKALLCAKNILELPEKIPSTQSKLYKEKAQKIHDSLTAKFTAKQ